MWLPVLKTLVRTGTWPEECLDIAEEITKDSLGVDTSAIDEAYIDYWKERAAKALLYGDTDVDVEVVAEFCAEGGRLLLTRVPGFTFLAVYMHYISRQMSQDVARMQADEQWLAAQAPEVTAAARRSSFKVLCAYQMDKGVILTDERGQRYNPHPKSERGGVFWVLRLTEGLPMLTDLLDHIAYGKFAEQDTLAPEVVRLYRKHFSHMHQAFVRKVVPLLLRACVPNFSTCVTMALGPAFGDEKAKDDFARRELALLNKPLSIYIDVIFRFSEVNKLQKLYKAGRIPDWSGRASDESSSSQENSEASSESGEVHISDADLDLNANDAAAVEKQLAALTVRA